jgi:hypothetical protein
LEAFAICLYRLLVYILSSFHQRGLRPLWAPPAPLASQSARFADFYRRFARMSIRDRMTQGQRRGKPKHTGRSTRSRTRSKPNNWKCCRGCSERPTTRKPAKAANTSNNFRYCYSDHLFVRNCRLYLNIWLLPKLLRRSPRSMSWRSHHNWY